MSALFWILALFYIIYYNIQNKCKLKIFSLPFWLGKNKSIWLQLIPIISNEGILWPLNFQKKERARERERDMQSIKLLDKFSIPTSKRHSSLSERLSWKSTIKVNGLKFVLNNALKWMALSKFPSWMMCHLMHDIYLN